MDPAFGGTVRATVELTRALLAAGIHSEILTLDDPAVRRDHGALPAPVHRVGPPRSFYRYCFGLQSWLDSELHRFDAVMIHGLWRHHSAGVWRGLRRHPRPYYLMAHSMLNPWFHRGQPLKHLRKALFWHALEHRTLRDARAVLFCSEAERDLARTSFCPFRCREAIVPLGLEDPLRGTPLSPEPFLARFPHTRGRRLILFLGRLHPMKACDLLIEAFAEVRGDFHLVMAGTDNNGWRADLEATCRRLGMVDQVTFTGPLFDADKWSALAAADLFALPSHCESFAYAAVEALATGLPVLVSNKVNSHPEMKAAGGAIVVNDDREDVSRGLRQWLNLNDSARGRMRQAARAGFLQHFRIEHSVRALIDLFRADLGWKV
jgi:glycosyltransferase involved in cell wall biosynthesis